MASLEQTKAGAVICTHCGSGTSCTGRLLEGERLLRLTEMRCDGHGGASIMGWPTTAHSFAAHVERERWRAACTRALP
jgi:hypothetical protein